MVQGKKKPEDHLEGSRSLGGRSRGLPQGRGCRGGVVGGLQSPGRRGGWDLAEYHRGRRRRGAHQAGCTAGSPSTGFQNTKALSGQDELSWERRDSAESRWDHTRCEAGLGLFYSPWDFLSQQESW